MTDVSSPVTVRPGQLWLYDHPDDRYVVMVIRELVPTDPDRWYAECESVMVWRDPTCGVFRLPQPMRNVWPDRHWVLVSC